MLDNGALSILLGPVGVMLIAAMTCAVYSLLAWRSASRTSRSDNTLAELFTPGTLEAEVSDPRLRHVAPRGPRRSRRDQRVLFAGKNGHPHSDAIPFTHGTVRDRGIVLEATRHLAKEGLLSVPLPSPGDKPDGAIEPKPAPKTA